jgi:alkylation response protein AidB-like acyl-CoA dehydrogenase
MEAASGPAHGQFDLNDDQRAIQEMTAQFAADRVAPHALDWDRERFFPSAVIRETGGLGFGGIYVGEEFGGSGLGRLDAVLIFEALSAPAPASRHSSRSTTCVPGWSTRSVPTNCAGACCRG